jgi:hypothetical protein
MSSTTGEAEADTSSVIPTAHLVSPSHTRQPVRKVHTNLVFHRRKHHQQPLHLRAIDDHCPVHTRKPQLPRLCGQQLPGPQRRRCPQPDAHPRERVHDCRLCDQQIQLPHRRHCADAHRRPLQCNCCGRGSEQGARQRGRAVHHGAQKLGHVGADPDE